MIYENSLCTSQKTQRSSIRRLSTKIMSVYCEYYTKHTTKLCGQKERCLYVKLDGKSSQTGGFKVFIKFYK